MDNEMTEYLRLMEERIGGRMDANLVAMEDRLTAKIEKVETKLLTEFHKWASPREARVRSHSATLRALDLEMEEIADRVEKLEKGAA